MKQQKLVIVGDIVNTHGLRGEVRVLSNSDFKKERFTVGNELCIMDKSKKVVATVVIEKYRVHKTFDLLTFKDKYNIQDVEQFKSMQLAIPKEKIRALTEDEGYYFDDITSCVVYQADILVGKVYKIIPMQAYDLWYIKRAGKKDLLLPFTDQFVKSIDVENGTIEVELLEGMDD